MEPAKFLWILSILFALAFEAANGNGCFSCSTSDINCRRHGMNEVRAPKAKRDNCKFCYATYATEPPNYVLRGCRPDEESYETERGSKYCKPMLGGGTRCFCKTEYCNGADLDKHLREFESGGGDQGGGDQTGTTPTSSAVAWRLSGVALSVGLILVKTIFML